MHQTINLLLQYDQTINQNQRGQSVISQQNNIFFKTTCFSDFQDFWGYTIDNLAQGFYERCIGRRGLRPSSIFFVVAFFLSNHWIYITNIYKVKPGAADLNKIYSILLHFILQDAQIPLAFHKRFYRITKIARIK